MTISVRAWRVEDLPAMQAIWNEVVAEGLAFPQEEELDAEGAAVFFGEQSHCGVAEAEGRQVGLYILHPNNVGRLGQIANASYAVAAGWRGRGIGRRLVVDSLAVAGRMGFRIMQFNAVVATNRAARALYESLGFRQLGEIPDAFRLPDGRYETICPYYMALGS
ncbi:MAG: GNAT family N-acetyltransferase [Bacillota bacterium]|nr:GNAT family N-acetyltransferase [Bacillota bacterium]